MDSDEESIGVPSILADNRSEDEYFPSDSNLSSASGDDDRGSEAEEEPDDAEVEAIVEGRPIRSRKRQRNEWKRDNRKRKRNSGQSYVTRKGKIVAEKQFSNLDCGCKKGCFAKITEQARRTVFESFWKMGTHSAQNAFLCGLIEQETQQRHRPTNNAKNPKSTTNKFYFNIEGKSEIVCKKYFLETLKISDGRMSRALKKVKTGEPPGDDKRGKKVPGNKTPQEKMILVRDHISYFPAYESHYTRLHNPNRKYLSEELNIRMMYNLYKESVEGQGHQPVEEHIYRRTFNNEYNLHFHAPHKDTCVKCDKFANKIKHTDDDEDKRKLQQEHELHLRKAEKARDAMIADTEKAANDNSFYAFTFDLEKSLSFPKLAMIVDMPR